MGRRAGLDRAARGAPRPVPQVRAAAGARARAGRRCEPMREHRFADGTVLALPSGSRSAQLEAVERGARCRASASSGSTTCTAFADTWDLLRRDVPRAALLPRARRQGDPALLRTRTTCTRSSTRTFGDQRLRDLALLHVPCWTATTRARCRPGWACGPTSSRASACGRCPAAWACWPTTMTKRLRRAPGAGAARHHGARPAAARWPRRRRGHRPAAPSTPTSWCARSTRAACRRSRRTSAGRCPRAPPAVCHLGLRR